MGIEIIIVLAVGALTTALGCVFLTGRGANLIAGYNTMPKEKKAGYNTSAMCKFAGKIMLPLGLLTLLAVFFLFNALFWIIYGIAVTGLCVFAVVYFNTGNRFKR
ncbi:MAG: DUF3784 domain-containing protein [Oscillospiraceae bacterium]|nr:DUF3784 domain-containing protein [Oscillospiraceae bacterium]